MSEIQRYDFSSDGHYPSNSGGWVDADEAEAKIKQLEQELESAKKDQARYLKLIETGNFCPTQYSGLWGLHMSGTPYTKAELDAPIDAAIKESSK